MLCIHVCMYLCRGRGGALEEEGTKVEEERRGRTTSARREEKVRERAG